MKRALLYWGVAAAAAVVLAACSSSPGIVRPPAVLTPIAHPQVQPEQLWSARIGNGAGGFFSGLRVAVREDAVFVGSRDGRAAAFNPKTGARVWETDTHLPLSAGPSVDGGLILFGTLDAQVVALDRATGKLVWKGAASSEVLASPVGNSQIVVVRSVDGRVYGLHASDGTRAWSFSEAEPRLTLRGQSMPLIVGDEVLVGQDDGTLVALDMTSGKVLWQQAIAVPSGRTELERLVDIDANLLGNSSAVFVDSYGDVLTVVDPTSGNLGWKRPIKSWTGMALSPNGNQLYISDNDGDIWALDPGTGAEIWHDKALHFRVLSAPAVQDGDVVVGDFEGYLHWLSPDSGHEIGRVRMSKDGIVAAPVVFDDTLYAMDTAGHVAAYRAKGPAAGS
ncbi:MAG TPA: outer membrane protein assembly factor BamB [Nevskiaceae bacterium]